MKETVEIDGTKDEIWNSQGGKIRWLIYTLHRIKEELKIDESFEIILPIDISVKTIDDTLDYFKDMTIDFDENFTAKITRNIIQITRIGYTESYKMETFKN